MLIDIPDEPLSYNKDLTIHDLALMDELSGLTTFMDNYLATHDMPETVKQKIRARYLHYTGKEDKTQALNRMRLAMYGPSR